MSKLVGMVIRSSGPHVTVRDPAGLEWRCILRGRLRRQLIGETSPVAVGDRVEVRPVAAGEGVVEALLPRRSRLARQAPSSRPGAAATREQVLAANLDLAVVVVPAPPRATVIDRYRALVAAGGCEALICVNKIDLVDRAAVDAAAHAMREVGVTVVLTSALTGEGVDELRQALRDRLSAFVGPSGAGKSSLLNALDPELRLRVGGMSASGKGSHTTSWSSIHAVGDGLVVDTPGLRQIGLLDDGPALGDDLFPEVSGLAAACRFRDCSHVHEPGCAVKRALEAGALPSETYRRYTKLLRSGRL